MLYSTLRAMAIGGLAITLPRVAALGSNDAEDMYKAFNNAFLVRSGGDTYWRGGVDPSYKDTETWPASLNILMVEDAYERTGSQDKKNLINDLLTTWLRRTPPPWSWDGYNDDIGWFTLALVRGYQITGNAEFLKQARYGFDYAYGRGWDTQYNNGGIWEQNPSYIGPDSKDEIIKEALSNDSLGKVACLLYQSTNDAGYKAKCRSIYDWVWDHLYNYNTGQIYRGVYRDGSISSGPAAYNQGTFLDYANLVWKVTGDKNVFIDAQRAIDYGRKSLTVDGIFSKPDNEAGNTNLNTWADEMARGVGNFVRDNKLWDTYYDWMVQNANAILANRRTDLGITWNGWAQMTPRDDSAFKSISNKYVSAAAWLQYTPATRPSEIAGIHSVLNQKTQLAIDSAGTFGNGNGVVQWGANPTQNQEWIFTQNSDDGSWNIINRKTWQALDCPASTTENGANMVQWQPNRGSNQRWLIDRQDDGSYMICNQASAACLDGASNTTNGAPLKQWGRNAQSQQRWIIR